VKRVLLLGRTAVIVEPYAAADEYGVRLEVRMLNEEPHRGTSGAAQRLVIDRPVWRADIFERRGSPPRTFASAHFHPRFGGLDHIEAGDRVTDPQLDADPVEWLKHTLSNLDVLYEDAGLRLVGDSPPWLIHDRETLLVALPEVLDAFERAYQEASASAPIGPSDQ